MCRASLCRFARLPVAAEPVVEDRLGVVDERQGHAVAARAGLRPDRTDQLHGLVVAASEGGEGERSVRW